MRGAERNRRDLELAEARRQIEASEEKFRTIFNSSRDAIMILDPARGFVSGNPAAIQLFEKVCPLL